MVVSTPEATAFDLVGYAEHAGGLDHVATLLEELAELMEPEQIAAVAETVPLAWAQRLGYLLSLVGYEELTGILEEYVQQEATVVTPLLSSASMTKAPRDARWKLAINTEVVSEL